MGVNVKVHEWVFCEATQMESSPTLIKHFLINMTTWEDSPDMLLIAATIKWTNTVSASTEGPNSLKR